MDRAEAIERVKKLPKAQLLEAFIQLTKAFDQCNSERLLNYRESRDFAGQAHFWKGRAQALEPPKPPAPPAPVIDYHKLIEATLRPRPTVVEVTRTIVDRPGPIVEVVVPKKRLEERIRTWLKSLCLW